MILDNFQLLIKMMRGEGLSQSTPAIAVFVPDKMASGIVCL